MKSGARIAALLSFATSGLLVTTGAMLVATASSASADPGSGGSLSVVAAPTVLADDSMAPGDTIYWPINVGLNASTSGHLTLKVVSSKALATNPDGLRLALASCSVAWTTSPDPTVAPTCTGGTEKSIIPDQPFAGISATKVWDLGTIARVSTTPIMATISLAGTVPSELQGAEGDMDFGFTALGTTVHASPSDPPEKVLGFTGIDPIGPILLALGLLLAGFTLARIRSRLARREDDRAETGAFL